MGRDVKKIIISVDNNKLTKVIIVKDNAVETYTSNNYNSNQLLRIYSNNVKNLKTQYENELLNLNSQDAIDKLSQLGKIEYKKKNLITNIKIYDQGTPVEKMFIDYEDGTREEYNLAFNKDYHKIKDIKLMELCNDYDLKYEELVTSGLVNVNSYSNKVQKIEEVKKENKIKNLVIKNKRLLSAILAGAITVTGLGIGIAKFSRKNKYESNNPIVSTSIETKNPESIIKTTPYISSKTIASQSPKVTVKPTNTPKVTIKPTDTISPTSTINNTIPIIEKITPPPIHISNQILFTGSINLNNDDSFNNNVLARKNYGNIVYLKKDRLEDTINSLNEIRTFNISSIGTKKFDKNELVIIYYENFLDNDNLKDKAFVKYFSNIGNKIIEYAYKNTEEGDNEVVKYANLSNSEAERLITNDDALEVLINGKQEKIYYKDLSSDAREIVQNIIWNNMQCLNNLEYENDYSENLIVTNYYGVDFYVFGDNKTYKTIGIKGVQPHNACLVYSRAWASDYMSGTTSFDSSGLTYYGVATENKQTALKVIMNEVMKGRPVVIRVNAKQAFYKGKIKSTPRHFVTVCGIRKNIDVNNLKESDFLIYDPTYSKRFKILGSHAGGGSNDRKLLKTEQNTGRRGPNYSDGYYLEVFNDSSNYLELDDVYEGKI